jgi:hypothetical protein
MIGALVAELIGNGEKQVTQFTVRRGRRYRAKIQLGLIEQLADNETIAERLREAGFADVTVHGHGPTRTAEALWPNTDASAPLPPQIVDVVETT